MDRALRRALAAAALLHAGAAAWAARLSVVATVLASHGAPPEAPMIVEAELEAPEEPEASVPSAAAPSRPPVGSPTAGGALSLESPGRAPRPRAPRGGREGEGVGAVLTAPTGSTTLVAGTPGPAASATVAAASPSSLEARLDAFDANKRPAWMPSRLGAGAKLDDAPNAEKLASKISKDLAQGADDRARSAGGYGGPVVSAAHDASMGPWAPQAGFAVIAIDFDDKGLVTKVTLVDASGDRPDWQKVADDVGKGLASKKVQLPSGAGGLRVTVKVQAKLAYPSGATDRVSGPTIGNDGTQATASVSFDLSDLGQKPKRIVGVVVLSETRL